jgi:hypothetical protein
MVKVGSTIFQVFGAPEFGEPQPDPSLHVTATLAIAEPVREKVPSARTVPEPVTPPPIITAVLGAQPFPVTVTITPLGPVFGEMTKLGTMV